MPEKSLSPEIIKLMDKISQNPTSRLFVPLAEEYLKCDMTDEAIWVLGEGIKNNPTYVAARVMLGKIYLQKKQFSEAKSEFEKVIDVNPENIQAHKKLAHIYDEEGNYSKAIEACKKIIKIDPSDKETKAVLSSLEEKVSSRSEALSGTPPSLEEPQVSDPTPSFEPLPEEGAAVQNGTVEPGAQKDEVFPPESTAGTDLQSAAAEAPPEGRSAAEALPEIGASEEPVQQPEDVPPPTGSIPLDDVLEMPSEPTALGEREGSGFPSEALGSASPSSEVGSAGSGSLEEDFATATLASLYMRQGHYEEAVKIYKKLLERHPSDTESLHGLEAALSRLSLEKPKDEISLESPSVRPGPLPQKAKTERLEAWLKALRKDREQ